MDAHNGHITQIQGFDKADDAFAQVGFIVLRRPVDRRVTVARQIHGIDGELL
jgi:hypothetical protein